MTVCPCFDKITPQFRDQPSFPASIPLAKTIEISYPCRMDNAWIFEILSSCNDIPLLSLLLLLSLDIIVSLLVYKDKNERSEFKNRF